MSNWWKKKTPLVGAVLFRGELPPQPEEFSFLANQNIFTSPYPNNTRNKWSIELDHSDWGKARLDYDQNAPLPSREVFEFTSVPESDKQAGISAGSVVALTLDSKHEHILRDRKSLLRYLRAVMGSDGVIAIDTLSQNVWTREALDDELSHDADLDVDGIYSIHAVTDDSGKPFWVHTHGLAEIATFDFDVIDPAEDLMLNLNDLCRAVAFHILEGTLQPSTPTFDLVYPKGRIKMVEMNQFLSGTDPRHRTRLISSANADHLRDRSVICEPVGSALSRLFGKTTLQPSRLLSGNLPENPMFSFSTTASDLMAERARNTYSVLRALRQEFAELDLTYIVKLGFRADDGGAGDREHMWLEVHELYDDDIDATLLNQPHLISGMKEGDRGRHSTSLLSDWMIMTPVGTINPRSTTPARIIRANPEAIRKMIEES